KAISPQVSSSNVNIKAGSKSSTTSIEASNESYAEVKSYTVSSGRFITAFIFTLLDETCGDIAFIPGLI
ncbi:MAG: hypothetical protein O7C56_06455, partial [Rickettsia endosymbiont of Ixodes persulcatus]|nr:hypothetical protein [Rickettsia endosymbiont of Ixodes persulcatus]